MRKKLQFWTAAAVVAAGIAFIFLFMLIYGKNKIDIYEQDIDNLYMEIENNRQIVYVAMDSTILPGDLILAEGEDANVMMQEIYSGLEPDYYITEEDLGSKALITIEPGSPILKSMVTPLTITQDTREFEITVVDLMVDQKLNDYIDIRIMFPNGEDYLVLAKKEIKNLVLGSSIFYTYMNEEEILRLSSATVDAYTVTGTKIYATRYVEGNLQKEATPNYLVKAETIDLMTSDPNILTVAKETMNVKARMSLESRLSGLTPEQLAAVSDGHGLQDTAKNAVLLTQPKIEMAADATEEDDADSIYNNDLTSDAGLSEEETLEAETAEDETSE